MKLNRLLLLSACLFFLPLFSFGQSLTPEFDLVQLAPGQYRFDIYGLDRLDQLEPSEIYDDPRYELFVELGDGYYIRETMDNPNDNRDTFSFVHNFSVREPEPELLHVTATPLYSPEKKPGIPDAAPSIPDPISWGVAGSTGGVKYDFVPGTSMVKADLNWNMLEADDMFVVIAGYQNGSSNNIGDLSDGGYLSVYYDGDLVEPVRDEGSLQYRAYDKNNEQSLSFGTDEVIVDKAADNINSHVDFDIPPMGQGQEEFVFVTFKLHDPETLGEVEEFPIHVVVRGLDDGEPSSSYESERTYGEVRVGKDPNYITGYPRPVCVSDNFDSFTYHVEFFNEGDAAVDSVKLEIEFPPHVQLTNASDIKILSARFGSPDTIPIADLTYSPEIISASPPVIQLIVARNGYLNGYSDPAINNQPEYYPHCSAEFEFEVPRNASKPLCDGINPLASELAITFPSGDVVTRRDTIPCQCLEEELGEGTGTAFPCNIVPDIPALGSCWCTFLLLLLIIVLLFLVIIIVRNRAS